VSTSAAILRTVVQHEVGHLVGFGHNSASQVMRADYNRNVNAAISLSNLDLVNLKNTYGEGNVILICQHLFQFLTLGNQIHICNGLKNFLMCVYVKEFTCTKHSNV